MRDVAMCKSHRLILTASIVGLMSLAGCMPVDTRPYVSPTVPLDEVALKAAIEPGEGAISGQAFSRTVGGEVRYAAGVPIYLIPVTPYVRECMGISGSYARSDCGSRLSAYTKQTTGDGEGRFKFKDLKPGDYYVEATITWGVPTAYGVSTTGGTVHKVVTVPDPPETVETILN